MKKEEYATLRDEMIARVQMMNTNNLGMITAVFAVWAIAGVFFTSIYKFILEDFNAGGLLTNHVYPITFAFIFLNILLVVPVAINLPLAAKSGDNFTQIASLSAYILAYWELPGLVQKNNAEAQDANTDMSAWEFFQQKGFYKKFIGRFFNYEYIILSGISLLLYLIATFSIACLGFNYHIINVALYLSIVSVIFLLLGVLFVFIILQSDCRKLIKERDEFLNRYIDIGEKHNIFTADECKIFTEMILMQKVINEEFRKKERCRKRLK